MHVSWGATLALALFCKDTSRDITFLIKDKFWFRWFCILDYSKDSGPKICLSIIFSFSLKYFWYTTIPAAMLEINYVLFFADAIPQPNVFWSGFKPIGRSFYWPFFWFWFLWPSWWCTWNFLRKKKIIIMNLPTPFLIQNLQNNSRMPTE